jgi:hypothetical protein
MAKWRSGCLTVAMFSCVAVVVVWEAAALIARRSSEPLAVSAGDFRGFVPHIPGVAVRSVPLGKDPLQPNVAAFEMRVDSDPAAPLYVARLVHGYNVVDCMRIKHFQERLLHDTREALMAGERDASGIPSGAQVWGFRKEGSEQIWLVAMLGGGDLAWSAVDTRTMAFPRVGTPDAASWNPTGLTWSSLRHPIRNLRLFVRAKWNASRCDLLTFLSLRRPSWVTDSYFTLVIEGGRDPENPMRHAVELSQLLSQLQAGLQAYGETEGFLVLP